MPQMRRNAAFSQNARKFLLRGRVMRSKQHILIGYQVQLGLIARQSILAAKGKFHAARSAAEYWTEERPLIASTRAVREFVSDVDALRDDVARFEKRVGNLINRQDAKPAKNSNLG